MLNDDITWALSSLDDKAEAYRLFEEYMDGSHRLDFVPSELRREFAALLRRSRLNMCPAVVTSVRDRLKLSGFTPTEGGAAGAVEEVWRDNRMDLRASKVHRHALTFGESFAVIWPDAQGRPVVYPNSPRLVTARHSEERPDEVTFAAKCWKLDDGRARLTLYYADRIEKYVTRQKVTGDYQLKPEAFIEHGTEEGGAVLPNPYDVVPVFHFLNGSDGVSELAEAVPVQDALNKTVRDLLLGGEDMALPQRYATGVEVPIDPATGRPVKVWTAGDLWVARKEDARFGQMDAANLEQLVKVKESFKMDMAMVTGTPPHYFFAGGGTPPSGESLKTLEFRLSSKVYDRQVSLGSTWEEVFEFCLRVRGEESELDAVWETTEPRNDKEVLEMAVTSVNELGGSRRQAWRERGYSEPEIDNIFREAATEDVIPMGVTQ